MQTNLNLLVIVKITYLPLFCFGLTQISLGVHLLPGKLSKSGTGGIEIKPVEYFAVI